jgi:hypothetical protein
MNARAACCRRLAASGFLIPPWRSNEVRRDAYVMLRSLKRGLLSQNAERAGSSLRWPIHTVTNAVAAILGIGNRCALTHAGVR